MPSDWWELIGRVWFPSLLGSGLLIVGVCAGWALASEPRRLPVRLVGWWVVRLVRPLLRCRSWRRCAAAIFVNNATVLTIVLAAGAWQAGALMATAWLGLSLGIGFRVLSSLPDNLAVPWPVGNRKIQRRIRMGIALNLLEPPAIAMAIGLSLSRTGAEPLSSASAWAAFVTVVLPLTLVAAGGEAVWLAASRATGEEPTDAVPADSDDSALDD